MTTPAAPPTAMADSKLHVLVVDDEPFIRHLVCRVLLDLGYRSTLEAENGDQGLKALRTAAWPVSLVVLDIAMPKMDGLAFLRYLRTDPASKYKQVPVVMLTGHSEIETLRECAKLGIHGFLAKPVSKANLEKQIKRALSSPAVDPVTIPASLV
jgi:two-component system, chemotaxis family, chemotaxis protein CheY